MLIICHYDVCDNDDEAIIDGRLCPQCVTHDVYLLFFITEQN